MPTAPIQVEMTGVVAKLRTPWLARLSAARWIAIAVAALYFLAFLFIFRGVAANIPLLLRGEAVINGDELVPFFNPSSQLIEQAAGKFNDLTNGYEFRVRYSILTTWMRYYKVLPFAIILVLPAITLAAYVAVSRFLAATLELSAASLYLATAGPVAVIFLILTYSKITHFYTLILGFSLFLIAALLMTYGLIFAERPYGAILGACVVTLLNPAVHYLVLFCLYFGMTLIGLGLMEIADLLRGGILRWIWRVREWWPSLTPRALLRNRRQIWVAPLTRCLVAPIMLGLFTVLPYALFVKYFALRGVSNLAETVPGDFYFITDASISLGHLLAFDMAGIMDKMISGDYLAKEPRLANMVYTLLVLAPLLLTPLRHQLFNTRPRRAFLFVVYINVFFSMWATLGYSEPHWLPTFHRTIALISRTAYDLQSPMGDLTVKLTSTIVQVLRFPHRFQLILFLLACVLMPISVAWLAERVQLWVAAFFSAGLGGSQVLTWSVLLTLFWVPFWTPWQYREVFFSGDFRGFLAPYPVRPLQEVKHELLRRPPGKVVVLPPTETAKVIVDIWGVEHKFIDKFHIYYLDLPSYYYGLTGDSDNKFEFFLLLRALYYQQDWWVNIARDLNIRYIVINKELIANTAGGAEYLREIERIIISELDGLTDYLQRIYENESYVLYEFTDLPQAERIPLLIDTDWNTFIRVLSSRLDLTRYYDLRHPVVSDDLTAYPSLSLLTDDPRIATLDLALKANPASFFSPSSSIFAFNPDIIPSSYYLSPMFRLFQFFSDSKWNRLNLITPGLFGTIKGSFIGLPRATLMRIDVKFPQDGTYHLFLRGAATWNQLTVRAKSLGYQQELTLQAQPGALDFFDQKEVFAAERQPLDINQYTRAELERLIPSDVVAVNYRYLYFDLGVVQARQGTHTFYFDKQDNNPLLVEGVFALLESDYAALTLPANVNLLPGAEALCCRALGASAQE